MISLSTTRLLTVKDEVLEINSEAQRQKVLKAKHKHGGTGV